MAKAKKCDRCGQYYDDNEINIPDDLIGRTNQSYNHVPAKVIIKTNTGAPGAIAELCDTCFESLFDWIGYLPEENPPIDPSGPEGGGEEEVEPPAEPEDNEGDQ